jgi:excinuclease ABC subunit C
MDLAAKVSHFPPRPGVYLMKDGQGRVLYVGKAKDLKGRVRNYFREGADGRPMVRFLMARVSDVDFVVTASEKEALILENTLIKRHRPRYNVTLRDDKTYLSLRLDVRNPFPRLTMVRQVRPDGALYFGPYSSARSLRETLELALRIFPLRQCSEREFQGRARPCIYCQIRGCKAPCCGLLSPDSYRRIVSEVVLFLRGRNRELLEGLRRSMDSAAARLDFEEAARLRDRIRAVELTLERQKAVTHDAVDRDALALVREGAEVQFALLVVRSGNLLDRRAYYFPDLPAEDEQAVAEFVQQYYREDRIVPPEVLLPLELPAGECEVLEEWLSERAGKRVRLVHPRRGEKVELLRIAAANARELLEERRKTKVGYESALAELGERLVLSGPPRRIECFDVSNVQGAYPVASMTVLIDGFLRKDCYRRFTIRTVEGSDDFSMLYEAISRRLARIGDGWETPDLLVVDGGRGQVAAAKKALEDAGAVGIALAGLAKGRVLPGSGEEVDRAPERVFLPGRVNPLILPRNSSALFLLQRARDEAHRFAVAHHRKRRSKAALSSSLDEIPGVGEKRRRLLLKHFGSVKRLRDASWEEIAGVPGVSSSLARRIAGALSSPPTGTRSDSPRGTGTEQTPT